MEKLRSPTVLEASVISTKSAPFEDQSIGVQLVLNQMLGIAVSHPEKIGTQYSITVKERD